MWHKLCRNGREKIIWCVWICGRHASLGPCVLLWRGQGLTHGIKKETLSFVSEMCQVRLFCAGSEGQRIEAGKQEGGGLEQWRPQASGHLLKWEPSKLKLYSWSDRSCQEQRCVAYVHEPTPWPICAWLCRHHSRGPTQASLPLATGARKSFCQSGAKRGHIGAM